MRALRALIALGLSFALALPGSAAENSSISATSTSKLKVGGTLYLPIAHEPSQFNPWHRDGNDAEINRMMSASLPILFNSDSAGKLTINKNYISSFTQTRNSPQTLRIVLNPKASWSDGKKISLTDFVGMLRALNGKNPNFEIISSDGYSNIKSIAAGKSSNEVIVTMSKPYADWQELFSPLLPASLTKDPATFNGTWRAKPLVSAGPFAFDSINREQGSISWTRNSKWWGTKPILENITYRVLPTESQLSALTNDELSYLDVTDNAAIIRQARSNPKFTIHSVPSSEKWEQIALNSKNPILNDVAVRQAIVSAINREALAQINTGLFVSSPLVKNNRIFAAGQACYKDTSGNWGRQNIARADQLLDQAGWIPATNTLDKDAAGKNKVLGMRYYSGPAKPGLQANQQLILRFLYPSGNAVRENIAMLTQAMLRAKPIGIDLQLVEVTPEDFFTKFVNPNSLGFDLTTFAWSSSTLPISGAMSLYAKSSTQNFAKDSVPAKLDSLIKKVKAEVNSVQRCALANQVDAELWENAFNLPLYDWPAASVTVKGLANFGSFGLATIDWSKIGFTK
ncbi:MAG: ABC transporter family substrate-binding protein [Actinomycetota bacterium]